jgi:hypothetical protein
MRIDCRSIVDMRIQLSSFSPARLCISMHGLVSDLYRKVHLLLSTTLLTLYPAHSLVRRSSLVTCYCSYAGESQCFVSGAVFFLSFCVAVHS